MISRLGQVMLYVENQQVALDFWMEKMGFKKLMDEDLGGGMRVIEIAPTADSTTTLMLHNKALIAEMSPELDLGTPSLMFYSDQLEQFHDELKAKGVTVGDLVAMPTGKVFNFADDEGNYFAVSEK